MIEVAIVFALAIQNATTTCQTNFGITTCNTYTPPAFQPMQPMQLPQQANPFDAMTRSMNAMPDFRRDEPAEPRPLSACAGGDWWLIDCSRGQHDEARRQRDAAAVAVRVRAETMTLLRAGDCLGAVNRALETGDLGFATEVRQFCAATPQSASSTPPDQ